MAKSSGLGAALYVAGVDLSGDTSALGSMAGGPNLLETTGINKSALERLGGLIDGTMNITTYWNSTGAHATYSTLPTSDVIACYLHSTTVGDPAVGVIGKQMNYDLTRGTDGSLTADVEILANGFGIEWGKTLTAGTATETGAGSGTAVDFGGAQNLGLRAFLQVLDFTGTDATIAIQDSADGSTGWADVSAFTQVTAAPTSERIQSSITENVKRYLRYNVTTTGGFSDLDFVVVAIQNTTAVDL